jgi:tRNA threonylcarbamoyladenosine biosynthesis protein TsaE
MGVGDVLSLTGGLGSGKTTFCQGLARGLGVPEDRPITSPTFSLVNLHRGRVLFAHADLYRLNSEAELEELGLDEAIEEGAAAIEWAERFPQVLPSDHLSLLLVTNADDTRTLTFQAHGPRSRRLLLALNRP